MDHLEEAARLLKIANSGGSEEDTGPSAEQIIATRAVASALVAIAKRLDVLPLRDEAARLNFPGRLADIVLKNLELIKLNNTRIDDIDESITGVAKILSERIDKLEEVK